MTYSKFPPFVRHSIISYGPTNGLLKMAFGCRLSRTLCKSKVILKSSIIYIICIVSQGSNYTELSNVINHAVQYAQRVQYQYRFCGLYKYASNLCPDYGENMHEFAYQHKHYAVPENQYSSYIGFLYIFSSFTNLIRVQNDRANTFSKGNIVSAICLLLFFFIYKHVYHIIAEPMLLTKMSKRFNKK